MAKYQMSYGFVDPTAGSKESESSAPKNESGKVKDAEEDKTDKGVKRKGAPNPPRKSEFFARKVELKMDNNKKNPTSRTSHF